TKSRERRADFGCRAREPLSRSIDPKNCILRMSRFTIAVDDVQVRSIDSFAIWIFVEVHDVPRRSFIAAAHAEQRRGRDIRPFPAFPGFGITSGDALKHLPRFFVTPLLIIRARD